MKPAGREDRTGPAPRAPGDPPSRRRRPPGARPPASTIPTLLLVALLASGGCGSIGPAPPPPARQLESRPQGSSPEGASRQVQVFGSREELHRSRIDAFPRPTSGRRRVTVKDTRFSRAGLRLAHGGERMDAYLQVYLEELTLDLVEDDFETAGVGGGLAYRPRVAGLGPDAHLTLPLEVEINGAYGKETVTTLRHGAPRSGLEESLRLAYLQGWVQVGVGVEMFGLLPSVGLAVDGRLGDQEYVAKDILAGESREGGRFRALNLGGYVGARYRSADFPAFAEVVWHFGGVAGVHLALGVEF